MLQPAPSLSNSQKYPATPTPYTPVKTNTPVEQATIGRSVVIKGEISGAEALYIDGTVEGAVHFDDNRVTIGRNGIVTANITAKEVVIMGKVTGNVECSDRLDIRAEGSLTGDVVASRISVEDGAVLMGKVEVRISAHHQHETEKTKANAATAGS